MPTILYLLAEIKTFSLVSGNFFYVFSVTCRHVSSRVDAPHAGVIRHSIDGQHVGRGPRVDVVCSRITTQIIETCDHSILQPLVDDIFAPEVAHPVLNPFKIRNCDTTGVRQDVGYNENTILMQHFICSGGGWPIGPFSEHFALDSMSILRGDLILSGRRDKHITFKL